MRKLLGYAKMAKYNPRILLRGLKGLIAANVFNSSVLRGVDLAVTYSCPATCEKCSARALEEKGKNEMSIDEITRLAGDLSGMGAIMVNLTGGEPLSRNDIIEIVSRLDRLPLIISLSTLGCLMTNEILKGFKNAGLDVLQLSLNSPYEKEHDEETGVEGSFRKVLEVIGKAKQLGIEVLINSVITKQILHSDRMEKLAGIARGHNCYLSLVLPAGIGGWKGKDVNLSAEDHALLESWLERDYVTTDTKTCYRRGACPAGTEKAYISPYGDLYPCPLVHKKYGNVLKEGFPALWGRMRDDMKKNAARCCLNVNGAKNNG